jgi:hypothetical protein
MPTFRYDDPDFSKRYDLVTASTGDTGKREVAALAMNREWATSAAPLSKYTTAHPVVIRGAERFARQIA